MTLLPADIIQCLPANHRQDFAWRHPRASLICFWMVSNYLLNFKICHYFDFASSVRLCTATSLYILPHYCEYYLKVLLTIVVCAVNKHSCQRIFLNLIFNVLLIRLLKFVPASLIHIPLLPQIQTPWLAGLLFFGDYDN